MTKIRKLVESELERAEIALAATDVSDSLQKMASDLSRITVDDLPPVVARIKAEYGIEKGNAFGASLNDILRTLTQTIIDTKGKIDDENLMLSSDSPIGGLGDAPDMGADLGGGEEEIDAELGGDIEGEDDFNIDLPPEDEEPALGRKVKESTKIIPNAPKKTPAKLVKESDEEEEGFKVSFKKKDKAKSDVFESLAEARDFVKYLKESGASDIKISNISESKFPASVNRLLRECDELKKKVVKEMYNTGPDGRRKVFELAKKVSEDKKSKGKK